MIDSISGKGNFDPFDTAWNFAKVCFLACDKQLTVFLHWNIGVRAYSWRTTLLAYVMMSLAAAGWQSGAIAVFGSLYSLLCVVHFIYGHSLAAPDMPDTHYDGTPHLLEAVIPCKEFPKNEYPVWFPANTEVLTKVFEPVAVFIGGIVMFDSVDNKLGLYLMLVAVGALCSVVITLFKDMNDHYDQIDAENRARHIRHFTEGTRPSSYKGFKAGLAPKAEKDEAKNTKGLTESEIKARVDAIKAKAQQAQAPPAEAEDTEPEPQTAPTPTPAHVPSSPRTSPEIIVFDETEAAPASTGAASNGNGATPKAPTTTAKVVKPPKAKKL